MSTANKWGWVAGGLRGSRGRRGRGHRQKAKSWYTRFHLEALEERALMSAVSPLEAPWPMRPAVLPADAYENDNTAARAKAITVNGTAQTHNINVRGDVDYVKFTLTAATDVVITTSGSVGDTELSLYNSNGKRVAYNNDSNGTFSKISTTLSAGTYCVRVNEYGNNATIAAYALAVTGSTSSTTTETTASYLLYTDYGGTYSDADKSTTNTDDDSLCWAATVSNMLEWTGWGDASGLTSADAIFNYFQSHWSDEGGHQYYGADWWFDGTNEMQGVSGWSQVEVSGGGFFTTLDFSDYIHYSSNTSTAVTTISNYLQSGYAVGLGLAGPGGHAVTCWGYEYTTGSSTSIKGIYITDSDDNQTSSSSDCLKYYEVSSSNGRWYLQDFYGSDSWYISDVTGLEAQPSGVTSTSTLAVAVAHTQAARLSLTSVGDATDAALATATTDGAGDAAFAQLTENGVAGMDDPAAPATLALASADPQPAEHAVAALVTQEQAEQTVTLLQDTPPQLRLLASDAVFEAYL